MKRALAMGRARLIAASNADAGAEASAPDGATPLPLLATHCSLKLAAAVEGLGVIVCGHVTSFVLRKRDQF